MIPKTNIQKIVSPIQAKIPSITRSKKNWAYKNVLDSYAMASRKRMFCLECGHKWNPGSEIIALAEQPRKNGPEINIKCPSCKNQLKLLHYNETYVKKDSLWSVTETYKDYQVIRISTAAKRMQKNKKAEYYSFENLQYWITKDGQILVFSAVFNSYTGYFEGGIELRPSGKEKESNYDIDLYPKYHHPVKKLLPEITRNGFKGEYHDLSPQLMYAFLMRIEGETLLKTGHFEMFKYFAKNQNILTKKVWTAIRICIRNNYKIKKEQMTDYIDYLNLLIYFGKDVNNSFYVCPKILDVQHNRLVQKKQVLDAAEMRAKQTKNLVADENKYKELKERFFDLHFVNNNGLEVNMIKSVMQVFEEGTLLHHCIFTNRYDKKPDTILLSATVDGVIMETIEVDIIKFRIIQARGRFNKPSTYNKEIVELVKQNMNQIQNIQKYKSQKKKAA